MNEILNLSINEMPRTEFDCSCGRRHHFSVQEMSIRKEPFTTFRKWPSPSKTAKFWSFSTTTRTKPPAKKLLNC